MEPLMDVLNTLHVSGQQHDGTETSIVRGDRCLSGQPYLWSQFWERAFIFPSKSIAEDVIRAFPTELQGAEVKQRHPEGRKEHLMATLFVTVLVTVLVTCTATGAYTFRVLDVPFPGASQTSVHSVTDQGMLAGNYGSAVEAYHHGFVSPDGQKMRHIFPLLFVTVQGMNEAGMVTGWYRAQSVQSATIIRGFLYYGGTLWDFQGPPRRLNLPGTPLKLQAPRLTEPSAINDHGVVVGDYRYPATADANGQVIDEPFHGFRYDSATGVMTTIDVPNTQDTALVGLNNLGQIIGYTRAFDETYHLFKWDNGTITFLAIPGLEDSAYIDLAGITDTGVLAGNAGWVGFVYDGQTVQMIEVPEARITSLAGIRHDGTVYGRFVDAQGEVHGFLATPSGRRMPHMSIKARERFEQADCDPSSKRRICRGR